MKQTEMCKTDAMNIDWGKTAALNGMGIDELKSYFKLYPSSGKRVIAVCEGCGTARETYFYRQHKLCMKCTKNLPEAREAARLGGIKRFSDPAELEAARIRAIKQWSDPTTRDEMSKIKKQYCIDNPEVIKEMSDRTIRHYINHPEDRETARSRATQYFKNQTNRDHLSKKMAEYYSNPENRVEASERIKNSEAHKIAMESQRGGHDIVSHHIAYDFKRRSALTVDITRKFHSQIHHPKGCTFGDRGYSLID